MNLRSLPKNVAKSDFVYSCGPSTHTNIGTGLEGVASQSVEVVTAGVVVVMVVVGERGSKGTGRGDRRTEDRSTGGGRVVYVIGRSCI